MKCLKHIIYLQQYTKIGKFTFVHMHIHCFFHICFRTWHTFYPLPMNIRIYNYANLKEMKIKGSLGEFAKIAKYPVYYVCFEVSHILVKLNSPQYCTR